MKKDSETLVIRDVNGLAEAMGKLSALKPAPDNAYTLTIAQEDEGRSNKQNRLSFMWYQIRGGMTGHGKEYERNLCKLTYGVPILRLEEGFNDFWLRAMSSLNYEQQLMAMEYIPVTSLMGMKQFAEYLTDIDEASAFQGIVLPHPEDLYWDALMKEAERHGP